MDIKQSVSEVIHRSCMALDAKNFSDYLELCDPAFHYSITAYSPEIRKDMIWMEHNKEGMKNLFDTLPRHNSDHAQLNRHANVCIVDRDEANEQVKVTSDLQVYRTELDGGATELFAIGKLYDTISVPKDGSPRLIDRNVRLDTRLLGMGNHLPI